MEELHLEREDVEWVEGLGLPKLVAKDIISGWSSHKHLRKINASALEEALLDEELKPDFVAAFASAGVSELFIELIIIKLNKRKPVVAAPVAAPIVPPPHDTAYSVDYNFVMAHAMARSNAFLKAAQTMPVNTEAPKDLVLVVGIVLALAACLLATANKGSADIAAIVCGGLGAVILLPWIFLSVPCK